MSECIFTRDFGTRLKSRVAALNFGQFDVKGKLEEI